MSDKKIGAGLVTLYRETDTPDTYGAEPFVLYDPIPEIDLSSESLTNTNTKSKMTESRAGITSAAPMAFKVKTSDAGYADILADRRTGKVRKWKFAIPSEGPAATSGVEEFVLTGWVQSVKLSPVLNDETFVTFTLNVNDVDGEA